MLFATEALLNEHGKTIAGHRFVIQVISYMTINSTIELNLMSYSLETKWASCCKTKDRLTQRNHSKKHNHACISGIKRWKFMKGS